MWRDEAACLGEPTDLFFSPSDPFDAQAICASCPVRAECLSDALQVPRESDYGIRGGFTRHQRRELRSGRDRRHARDAVLEVFQARPDEWHNTFTLATDTGFANNTTRQAVGELRRDGIIEALDGNRRGNTHRLTKASS